MLAATLLASAALARGPGVPGDVPGPARLAARGDRAGKGTTFYVGSRVERLGLPRRRAHRRGRHRSCPARRAAARSGSRARAASCYVAGGPTRLRLRLRRAHRREPSATHDFDGTFVNDVTVTRRAAYFTDSNKPFIYVYPRGRAGARAVRAPVTGDFVYGPGLNANGIAATPDGRTLILVQTGTGKLFTADPRTGATQRDRRRRPVPNGDGILLRGRTLYVVQNRLNKVAVLRLRPAT